MAKDAEKLAGQSERIKELRRFARVSQETAASAIGVTLRGYQRWERGEGEISTENIKKLSAYFGTTPDYIEYGQMARAETPDPFASTIEDRLKHIEQQLETLTSAVRLLATAGLPQAPTTATPASRSRRGESRRSALG